MHMCWFNLFGSSCRSWLVCGWTPQRESSLHVRSLALQPRIPLLSSKSEKMLNTLLSFKPNSLKELERLSRRQEYETGLGCVALGDGCWCGLGALQNLHLPVLEFLYPCWSYQALTSASSSKQMSKTNCHCQINPSMPSLLVHGTTPSYLPRPG